MAFYTKAEHIYFANFNSKFSHEIHTLLHVFYILHIYYYLNSLLKVIIFTWMWFFPRFNNFYSGFFDFDLVRTFS
jgi:hypothetical protein